jgi:uncharacterized Zn-binding protein involved in type VI secretion
MENRVNTRIFRDMSELDIIETLIGGRQIAFDGDELSCGAKLISSFKHFSAAD